MDLMGLLALKFPGVQAHCVGDITYANFVWDGGEPMPSEEVLMQAHLKWHKDQKITQLSADCQKAIIQGFVSSALGYPCKYDSQNVDQLNLVGSFLSASPDPTQPDGAPTYYAIRQIVDGVEQPKTYVPHDYVALKKVLLDGVAFKLAKLYRFNQMRNNILAVERTVEEIEAITWETELV